MNKRCRCALATLIGAIVLATAIVAVGVSTGRMMSDGAVNSYSAPSVIDLRPNTHDRQPVAAPDMFDRS